MLTKSIYFQHQIIVDQLFEVVVQLMDTQLRPLFHEFYYMMLLYNLNYLYMINRYHFLCKYLEQLVGCLFDLLFQDIELHVRLFQAKYLLK